MRKNLAAGYRVLRVRSLTEHTYVVRFERQNLDFLPGQHLSVGLWGHRSQREYSIYSPKDVDYLEILVKEVEDGEVSRILKKVRTGDELDVQGPFGYFTLDERPRAPLLFVSTGTGISPFHSMVLSYPDLDYRILHGVRNLEERYEHECFDPAKMVSCVSREPGGAFRGRVTDYLKDHAHDPGAPVYLCGNCDMIYDAFDILKVQGFPPGNIHTEVYF